MPQRTPSEILADYGVRRVMAMRRALDAVDREMAGHAAGSPAWEELMQHRREIDDKIVKLAELLYATDRFTTIMMMEQK